MAYSAEFAWTGSTGESDIKSGYKYEAVWKVHTDDAFDQAQRVIHWFIANIQGLGVEYQYANDTEGSHAYSKRIRAERDLKTTTLWFVTVDYEPFDGGGGEVDEDGNPTDNPLDFRPKIAVRTNRYTTPVEKATYLSGFTGDTHLNAQSHPELVPMNSAWTPYNPGLEKDDIRLFVSISRNLAEFDSTDAMSNVDKINSHAFQINYRGYKIRCLARDAKLADFDMSTIEMLNGIEFWPVTWGFDVKNGGWIDEVVDRGFHAAVRAGDPDGRGGQISSADILDGIPRVRELVDLDEMPLSDPVLLDGNGQPLPFGAQPVWVRWLKYEEYNFLTLEFFEDILKEL